MADFQSSLTAQELENRWTGTVQYNTPTFLTDSEKAQARENIGAAAFGSTLRVLGHYDTYSLLIKNVTRPEIGDTYTVGYDVPYTLYIYEGSNRWRNYGDLRASDIVSRIVTDQGVSTSAWTSSSIYSGYKYKANISIPDIKNGDYPMVTFEPDDAMSGNFCPVCVSFNGGVTILAKTKPTAAINIPVIAYIVGG